MENRDRDCGNNATCVWGFLAGLLVGGLAGAGAMLLLAPQSGKETRAQIQQKGIELRDQTVKAVEGAATQACRMTENVREQAGELQRCGEDVFDEQRDRLSDTLKGWGKAVKS